MGGLAAADGKSAAAEIIILRSQQPGTTARPKEDDPKPVGNCPGFGNGDTVSRQNRLKSLC
jgi:hypothetical protein